MLIALTARSVLHALMHVAVPGMVARLFFRHDWRRAWLFMVATMLVDLDHLLADPIYDPNRCSIGFHPLHGYWAIGGYVLLIVPRSTRLVGLGLVIHMTLDALDCLLM
jgi:hypothetical protein